RQSTTGQDLNANQTDIGDTETYQLEFQAGRWRFRTRDDKFWRLSAIGTGISGNGEARDPSTLFEMQPLPRGRVSLRCSNGAYLAAKKLGALNAAAGGESSAGRRPAEEEQFRLVLLNRPVLVFRCGYGFIGVRGSRLECNLATYDMFQLEHSANGYFIKSSDGYWSILGDASISFRSSRPEEFVFEFCNRSCVAILAQNGCYVRGEQNGTVRADSSAITDNCLWEKAQWSRVRQFYSASAMRADTKMRLRMGWRHSGQRLRPVEQASQQQTWPQFKNSVSGVASMQTQQPSGQLGDDGSPDAQLPDADGVAQPGLQLSRPALHQPLILHQPIVDLVSFALLFQLRQPFGELVGSLGPLVHELLQQADQGVALGGQCGQAGVRTVATALHLGSESNLLTESLTLVVALNQQLGERLPLPALLLGYAADQAPPLAGVGVQGPLDLFGALASLGRGGDSVARSASTRRRRDSNESDSASSLSIEARISDRCWAVSSVRDSSWSCCSSCSRMASLPLARTFQSSRWRISRSALDSAALTSSTRRCRSRWRAAWTAANVGVQPVNGCPTLLLGSSSQSQLGAGVLLKLALQLLALLTALGEDALLHLDAVLFWEASGGRSDIKQL
uniref:Fascin domain-containing protein n=1 Tax=Macrostomum lignano TaxID=282301 RepID=A0A1I8IXI9_9PLAT